MNAFIYILHFETSDKYYVGSTTDIDRRLKQHLSGHTPSTKRLGMKPKLVFCQSVDNLAIARSAERRIKSWKRRDYVERIIADGSIAFLEDMHP